jgi:hypothetical protein
MIETLNPPQASVDGSPSYEELERAVLGGATAIHSLRTERDELRSRLEIQERELAILRAANDDLRRQLVLIGDCYVNFATSCVVQLQHVSHAMEQLDAASTGFHANQSVPARG